MKCYVDAKSGIEKDAVAVCAVCGMGLCMEHVHPHELPLQRWGSDWINQTAMQILCETCEKAMHLAK
jgi:hypothetical protein